MNNSICVRSFLPAAAPLDQSESQGFKEISLNADQISMIVWTGRGFMVFLFVLCFSWIANLITDSVTGSGAYWEAHKWPFGLSLIASATVCWLVGNTLRKQKGRLLIDAQTGEEVVVGKSHTLFFIPMIWWAPILGVFALIVFAVELAKR